MFVVSICEATGWTYEEYLDQPEWFVDLFAEKLKIDNRKKK